MFDFIHIIENFSIWRAQSEAYKFTFIKCIEKNVYFFCAIVTLILCVCFASNILLNI